jgi:hypothetical protein
MLIVVSVSIVNKLGMKMNKIMELAEQAGKGRDRWNTTEQFDDFLQKFAKLIVNECISELETSKEADSYTGELFVSEKNTILNEQIVWLKDYFEIKE